jgi:hypothetical protein
MDGAPRVRRSHANAASGVDVATVVPGKTADEIVVTRATEGFCGRCGEAAGLAHACAREARAGAELEPDRFCEVCGSRLTVQVLPQGVESQCLRCTRRARRSVA